MVYFGFNSFSGRLSPATSSAYSPQGVQASMESTPFKFDSSSTKAASAGPTTSSAQTGGSTESKGIVPRSKGYQNVVKLQKAWAVHDGLLVWQKRGIRDAAPMWLTAGLIAVGFSIFVKTTYKMAVPPVVED